MNLDMREKAAVDALRLVDGEERNREQNFLKIVSDYRTRIAELETALVWCGGSSDFCPGGIAREGWMKVCAPLLQQPKP